MKLWFEQDMTRKEAGVRVFLRNDTSKTVRFLYWRTALDALSPDGISVHDSAGYSVPYRGPRAKRLFSAEHSLLTLHPGAQAEAYIDIPDLFALPARAVYTVSFTEPLRGLLSEDSWTQTTSPADLRDLSLDQAALNIVLTPQEETALARQTGDDALPSNMMDCNEDRKQLIPLTAMPTCSSMFFCLPPSYKDGGTCVGTHYISYPRVKSTDAAKVALLRNCTLQVHSALLDHKIADTAAYRRWFGAYSQERAARVRQVLNGLKGQQQCKTYEFYTGGLGGCDREDTLAWFRRSTDPRQLSVGNFCPGFFKLGAGDFNTQVGTVAHELTHGYGDTVDHDYGLQDCQALARLHPDKAVENADSYQFYFEDTVF